MSDRKSSGGISFIGGLQLLFIALKIIGKINWSWLLVLAPTWIGLLLITLIVIIYTITRR